MGWFKSIFSRQGSAESTDVEVSESATIELDKLPAWIETKLSRKFEEVKPIIEKEFSAIMEAKKLLFSELEELKIAELHNPDIPEREKQIMEGNRNTFISQHRQFMNLIEVSENITYKEASLFCKNFEDVLSKLASSTSKSQFVLKQFFNDSISRVNRSIKAMGESVSSMEDALKDKTADVEAYEELLEKTSQLKAKKKSLSECIYELDVLRKKLANSEQLKKKLAMNAEQLKQSESYAEFETKEKEKQDIQAELKKTDEEINSMFFPLDRPMRKFERMLAEDTEVFSRYINDAVSGLVDDEQLRIIRIMEKMKKHVEDESLGLKDKEKEKAIERISRITSENLAALRKAHIDAKHQLRKIDEDIRSNVSLQDLDGMQYKIEHTDNQIKILLDKISALEKAKEKIDIDAMRQSLEQEIKEILKSEVSITWKQDSSSV